MARGQFWGLMIELDYLQGVQKKLLTEWSPKILTKIKCCGPGPYIFQWTLDITKECLIPFSLRKKRPTNIFQRQARPSLVEIASGKGCCQLVIEGVHCGSSRILLTTFLGHPVNPAVVIFFSTACALIVCIHSTPVTLFCSVAHEPVQLVFAVCAVFAI